LLKVEKNGRNLAADEMQPDPHLTSPSTKAHRTAATLDVFSEYQIDFADRWYLGLLALIPRWWWLSFSQACRAWSGATHHRASIRSAVAAALIFALAEMQLVRVSEHLDGDLSGRSIAKRDAARS